MRGLCPVCRAELTRRARRCFAEVTCPVCLTTCSKSYVLPCGHCVCADDLRAIGGEPELPDRVSIVRKLTTRMANAPRAALQPLISLLLVYFALRDPGAPAQALYRLMSATFGFSDGICTVPCLGVRELSTHSCRDDCECDGARTCSLYGFCTGLPGECAGSESASTQWRLEGSTARQGQVSPAQWTFSPVVSILTADRWESTWADFSLGHVSGLSAQIRGRASHGTVRIRGPEGFFVRVQVTTSRRPAARVAEEWRGTTPIRMSSM